MKTSTLVDTNVLIDVLGPDSDTRQWSADILAACRGEGPLVINTVVWSELAPLVASEVALQRIAEQLECNPEMIPWKAAFLAGKAHMLYRRSGGVRERTLPDFMIGAHALVGGHRVLTRDAGKYRSYFPEVEVISPETHP